MVRNNVDTRHGLSTRHTRVMENSRGKSRRRDGTLENSVRRSRREEKREGEKRCKRESRESASRLAFNAPNSTQVDQKRVDKDLRLSIN